MVNRANVTRKKKDTDDSGVADHSDFCEILGVDPSPATQKLFKMFDTENTGQIRMKEVSCFSHLNCFTHGVSREVLPLA